MVSSMKKRLFKIGIGILILFLILFGLYKLAVSRTYQLFGEITSQVETNQKVVALTFDDGPTKNVDQIIPLLRKFDAQATFFLIGNEIEKNPDEAKKIVDAGYQVGNHTYSHDRMVFKSPSFVKEEIEKTDKLIRKAGYKKEIDFRPPYGKKLFALPYYLDKHNRETIMWNLEPDTFYSSASDKIKYVKNNIKPGSIILIHPMYNENELQTIEGILQSLTNEGYKFVTVDELQKIK